MFVYIHINTHTHAYPYANLFPAIAEIELSKMMSILHQLFQLRTL